MSKDKIAMSHYQTFETGRNLMRQDLFHMATRLGSNVTVMYRTHPDTHMDYLIVVDTTTGDSVKLNFGKEEDSSSDEPQREYEREGVPWGKHHVIVPHSREDKS